MCWIIFTQTYTDWLMFREAATDGHSTNSLQYHQFTLEVKAVDDCRGACAAEGTRFRLQGR